MKEIVLASASPRRSELLAQIGIPFAVMPSEIEEGIEPGLSPENAVAALAYEKALHVARKLGGNKLVIGADTVVVKNGILGKPVDEAQARSMLKALQGGWHEVVTGVAVIDALSLKGLKDFEKTRVKIKELSDDFIAAYVKSGEPMDKAGSYAIQGLGAVMVEQIEGCYFNVVGLPLMKLSTMLEALGIKIYESWRN